MSQWINAKDRLPLRQEDVKNYASVVVIAANSDNEVLVVEFEMGNTVEPWHAFKVPSYDNITHWMPLPTPPEST